MEKDREPAGVAVHVEPAAAAGLVKSGVGVSAAAPGALAGAVLAGDPVGVLAPGGLALSVMEGPRDKGPLLMKPRPSVTKRPT